MPRHLRAKDPARHEDCSDEEKARIVEESDRPGTVQEEVAACHGISAQTLRQWRSRARARGLSSARGVRLPGSGMAGLGRMM